MIIKYILPLTVIDNNIKRINQNFEIMVNCHSEEFCDEES